MLVVVRQVLQLLLAVLQDTEEKAQAWIMTLTCKRRFSAILLYLLTGVFSLNSHSSKGKKCFGMVKYLDFVIVLGVNSFLKSSGLIFR